MTEQNECRNRAKSGLPVKDRRLQGREQTDNERHERFTYLSTELVPTRSQLIPQSKPHVEIYFSAKYGFMKAR